VLGQVRVPDQLELAKKYTLSNYPQLFIFRYGKKYEYTGPKDSEEGELGRGGEVGVASGRVGKRCR